MKNYLKAVRDGLLAFWHAFRGTPLANAREAHQASVRGLYRASAEVTYNDQLATYYDHQARAMDPHTDWHLFAQLKDHWQDHRNEEILQGRRLEQARARVEASAARLQKLEQTG